MKTKRIIGRLLMSFVLVSIGFAIGKETAGSKVAATAGAGMQRPSGGLDKVVVYYIHGVPCITCTFIETTTAKLVRQEFAQAVPAGKMEFVSLNYLDPANAALAEKYNVGANMVIAVRFENGREAARVRMDEVMERASDAGRLAEYLRKGIQSALAGGGP